MIGSGLKYKVRLCCGKTCYLCQTYLIEFMTKKKRRRGNTGRGFSKQKLSNLVLGVFSINPTQILNYKQVAKRLDIIHPDQRQQLSTLLLEMVQNGQLTEVQRGKFKLKGKGSYIFGKVDMTQHGYAFIVQENGKDDIFVSRNNLNRALNDDYVRVHIFPKHGGKRLEGEVVEIIERARRSFVGIIEMSHNFAFLVPDRRQMPHDLFIPLDKLKGAQDGDKAVARITRWSKQAKNPMGEIIEVLGPTGENETEMHAILAEFELPLRFSPEVIEETKNIPAAITQKDIQSRKDFRKVPTFTIDPPDAKDYDDALSIRPVGKGEWEVGIHIADVTHYVQRKTLLDAEAYERGTSVYLVDRVVSMLPERLSNEICSLRPGEDKLCFSAVFVLNEDAEVRDEWFGRTVINSDRRFNYDEAQEIIESGKGDMNEEVLKLHELAQIMRKRRFEQGAFNFEKDEIKIDVDEEGKPVRVYYRDYRESNMLVEEFMLLANKRVAELIGLNKLKGAGDGNPQESKARTFVYRVHDKPDPEKIESFAKFIKKFGYQIRMGSNRQISDSMNKLIVNVRGTKEQNIIETLAVRSMAKAEYSTENIGHYGLAFRHYTHFTSPIRRFPDMMVHRLLCHYLDGGSGKSAKKYESYCEHASNMEKKATDAERASVKYKQVEFMQDKVGQEFEGVISGVTDWGLYVELVETKCEGMVSIHELDDDIYEFDEENYRIIGRRNKKTFQLGDDVRVEVLRTNLAKKQMDLHLIM